MKRLVYIILLFTLSMLTSGCVTLEDALRLTLGVMSIANFGAGMGGFTTMDIALDVFSILEASGTATRIIVENMFYSNTEVIEEVINFPDIEDQFYEYELSNMKVSFEETDYQQSLCY